MTALSAFTRPVVRRSPSAHVAFGRFFIRSSERIFIVIVIVIRRHVVVEDVNKRVAQSFQIHSGRLESVEDLVMVADSSGDHHIKNMLGADCSSSAGLA